MVLRDLITRERKPSTSQPPSGRMNLSDLPLHTHTHTQTSLLCWPCPPLERSEKHIVYNSGCHCFSLSFLFRLSGKPVRIAGMSIVLQRCPVVGIPDFYNGSPLVHNKPCKEKQNPFNMLSFKPLCMTSQIKNKPLCKPYSYIKNKPVSADY